MSRAGYQARPAPLSPTGQPRDGGTISHPSSIPGVHREAAEAVRQHLVQLRGGAPFLSPADALQLVRWLDAGVDPLDVLTALDRCADARRKRRARTRFTLVQAKRHLGRSLRSTLEPGDAHVHAFQPLADALTATGDPTAAALSDELTQLADGSVLPAVQTIAKHQQARWEGLPDDEREQRMARAVAELGDLAHLVDEPTLASLAEEIARHALRAEWPRVDAATLRTLAAR